MGVFLFGLRCHALAILGLFFFSSRGFAAPKSGKFFFEIEAGIYATHLKERFSGPDRYRSHLGSFTGALRVRPGFSLGGRFTLEPVLGALLPFRSNVDGSVRTLTLLGNLDMGIRLFDFWKFRAGVGLQTLLGIGTASTVELRNGGGTSYFYTPEGTQVGFLLTVQTGFEFRLSQRLALGLELVVPKVFSSDRRRFNGLVTLGYFL